MPAPRASRTTLGSRPAMRRGRSVSVLQVIPAEWTDPAGWPLDRFLPGQIPLRNHDLETLLARSCVQVPQTGGQILQRDYALPRRSQPSKEDDSALRNLASESPLGSLVHSTS